MRIAGGLLAALLAATPLAAEQTSDGIGAWLRGVDKISGDVTDLEVANGAAATLGRLTVAVDQCRFPLNNPSGDAFAFLTITDELSETPVFQGWMIASSPGLSALDHPRYDVWLLRCVTTS